MTNAPPFRLSQVLRHPGGRRVELYLLPQTDHDVWTLVAVAGEAAAPETPELQGPYRSRAQARDAIRRVAALLEERGFIAVAEQRLWELPAARALRALRAEPDRPIAGPPFRSPDEG